MKNNTVQCRRVAGDYLSRYSTGGSHSWRVFPCFFLFALFKKLLWSRSFEKVTYKKPRSVCLGAECGSAFFLFPIHATLTPVSISTLFIISVAITKKYKCKRICSELICEIKCYLCLGAESFINLMKDMEQKKEETAQCKVHVVRVRRGERINIPKRGPDGVRYG